MPAKCRIFKKFDKKLQFPVLNAAFRVRFSVRENYKCSNSEHFFINMKSVLKYFVDSSAS